MRQSLELSPVFKVDFSGLEAIRFALQLERRSPFQLTRALLAMLPAPKSKVRHGALEALDRFVRPAASLGAYHAARQADKAKNGLAGRQTRSK